MTETLLQILLVGGILLVMFAGLIGTLAPMVPGAGLILLAAAVYASITKFTVIGWGTLAVLAGLAVISFVFDYLASGIGAKRAGATTKGVVCATIGGIVGVIVASIPGMIIGPFVGAVLGEMWAGKSLRDSSKAGLGTLVGFLGGVLFQFMCGLAMILVFVTQLIF
ncbi:DUF456 domain-containing protein [Candidatus Hydrogenedentota bacterium]